MKHSVVTLYRPWEKSTDDSHIYGIPLTLLPWGPNTKFKCVLMPYKSTQSYNQGTMQLICKWQQTDF